MTRLALYLLVSTGCVFLTSCVQESSIHTATYYPYDRKPSGYLRESQPADPTPACFGQVIADDYGRPTVACISQTGTATFTQ